MEKSTAAIFANLVDLASERLGGRALWATDEFFAAKENLLKPGRGEFTPSTFNDTGQVYDGWETRRKGGREGCDSCIVRLGVPGQIMGVDIDTNHFLGNFPYYACLDALESGSDDEEHLLESESWTNIVPRVPIGGGSHNIFSALSSERRWTHVRLNIYPDGGVARLRVYGKPVVDWRAVTGALVDLAACEYGGFVECCNDMFFGSKDNLILPGRGLNMGDGWETRRRREPGFDWAIIRLGCPGRLAEIEVDTAHFKGNYPERCWVDAVWSPDLNPDYLTWPDFDWVPILEEQYLGPDGVHVFADLLQPGPWTHVRLCINNGGVSRLRVRGTPCP